MYVNANLSAAETYTDEIIPIVVDDWKIKSTGLMNVSISGTWAGTLSLERCFHNEETWHTVESFITNEETQVSVCESNVAYRIGFAAGAYTSGTANVRLSY